MSIKGIFSYEIILNFSLNGSPAKTVYDPHASSFMSYSNEYIHQQSSSMNEEKLNSERMQRQQEKDKLRQFLLKQVRDRSATHFNNHMKEYVIMIVHIKNMFNLSTFLDIMTM